MATKNASVRLLGRFPAGSKVGLYPRHGDYYSPDSLGDPVATRKADKDGGVVFTDLQDGQRLWVTSDADYNLGVSVTAKVRAVPSDEAKARPVGPEARQLHAQNTGNRSIVVGPRSSLDARPRDHRGHQQAATSFADPQVGQPAESKTKEREPLPQARIEDQPKGTVLRSDTPTGEAHPVDPSEPVPHLRQEDVGKGVVQRSDTETGDATPKPKDEVAPALRQEDVPKGVEQRSATETGDAVPKPKQRGANSAKKAESVESKAKGATKAKPKEASSKKTQKASAKKQTARTKRLRSTKKGGK